MEIEERIIAARKEDSNSKLLQLCREHGLAPERDISTLHGWIVKCPSGHPHHMLLSTGSETWGCGYCRRKGGLEELEDWLKSSVK